MKVLKWISIYIGIMIILFSFLFCITGVLKEGWIIYVNQQYDNIEKLNYKIEKDNINNIKQQTIEAVLEKSNIKLPEYSNIQKIICTKALSNGYNVKIIYINNNEICEYSKIDEYGISNYIMDNGHKYKDNTCAKIKICIIIILLYAIIEVILIRICKKQ